MSLKRRSQHGEQPDEHHNLTSSQMSLPMEGVPFVSVEDAEASAVAQRRASSIQADGGQEELTYPLFVSQRLLFIIVSFFGFFTSYVLRMSLSIAIVAMVNRTEKVILDKNILINASDYMATSEAMTSTLAPLYDNFTLPGECPKVDYETKVIPGEFQFWTKQITGHILGGFYIGYTLGQIPTGYLAQTFGGKRVIAACFFLSGVITLLLPVAARGHWVVLILLRVATGFFQACTFPAMQSIYARWLPPNEKSGLIGFAYSGSQVGGVAAIFLSGLLCQYVRWDSVFYVWGSFCVLWSVAWFFLVYDSPQVHPRISTAERHYIEFSLADQKVSKKSLLRLPFKQLATSLPLWAIFITHFLCCYGNSVFYTCIPLYMADMLNVDMKANGVLSSLPFIGMALMTIIGGQVADFCRRKGLMSTEWIRKILTAIGSLLPGMFEVIMVHLGCGDMPGTVTLLILSVSFTGYQFGGGYMVNIQDIAPAYSSLLFGLANTWGAVPGFVAPMVVGALTPTKSRAEWRRVFYICGGFYALAALFFLFAAKGVVQSWAKEDEPALTGPNAAEKGDGTNVDNALPLLASPNGGDEHGAGSQANGDQSKEATH